MMEELPSNQLSDESAFLGVDTAIKKEVDLETESVFVSPISNTVVKEEFICQELQHDQLTDTCICSSINTVVKEEFDLVEESPCVSHDRSTTVNDEELQYRQLTDECFSRDVIFPVKEEIIEGESNCENFAFAPEQSV